MKKETLLGLLLQIIDLLAEGKTLVSYEAVATQISDNKPLIKSLHRALSKGLIVRQGKFIKVNR